MQEKTFYTHGTVSYSVSCIFVSNLFLHSILARSQKYHKTCKMQVLCFWQKNHGSFATIVLHFAMVCIIFYKQKSLFAYIFLVRCVAKIYFCNAKHQISFCKGKCWASFFLVFFVLQKRKEQVLTFSFEKCDAEHFPRENVRVAKIHFGTAFVFCCAKNTAASNLFLRTFYCVKSYKYIFAKH